MHLDGVDAGIPLKLGAVKCLWCQADLAAYKRVILGTICAVAGAGKKHVLEAYVPDDDHVKLVPAFPAWITPGHPVLWVRLEEGIGHTQAVVREHT